MTATNHPDSLPDTMSDLLAAAINDARSLDPSKYQPSCYEWHTPSDNGPCEICLAGSLMAVTLHTSPDISVTPLAFTGSATRKLESLNSMRFGEWIIAYKTFYMHFPNLLIGKRLFYLPQPKHSNFSGWVEFRKHLESLELVIDDLRSIERDAKHA